MTGADSFDTFYRNTHRRVLTYLYAVTGDLPAAQDLTQEAYARAWQRWGRLAAYDDPEAWVRTVGWRLASSRWRAWLRWLAVRQRLERPADLPAPSPDNVVILDALQQLPRPQREAVVLHHLYGMPVADIAAATGVATGTVKARLSRGRATLAALLNDPGEDRAHA